MQVFYHACTIKKSAEVTEVHSSRANLAYFDIASVFVGV